MRNKVEAGIRIGETNLSWMCLPVIRMPTIIHANGAGTIYPRVVNQGQKVSTIQSICLAAQRGDLKFFLQGVRRAGNRFDTFDIKDSVFFYQTNCIHPFTNRVILVHS